MRWWLVLLVAGCKAGVQMPDYGPPPDEATPADLVMPDYATPADLTRGPDLCPMGPENCSDGCDNDGNNYADAEDPACAPIAIAGLSSGEVVRWTLKQPPVFYGFLTLGLGLDPWGAAYDHSVSPGEAWATWGPPQKRLDRIDVSKMMTTNVENTYTARDVCLFQNTVIVVEQGANNSWKVHQLTPNGMELGQVMLGAPPAACASDGKTLYVAVHSGNGPSQFYSFDIMLKQDVTRAMPGLGGLDRCIDFAWTAKAGFYGLFAASGGAQDFQLAAKEAWPFAMDGGVGVPALLPDGSSVHSLGGFAP
jgi:hypothetical protein